MESPENKQRKIEISIRVNEEEHRILKKKSKQCNLSMAAFLRQLGLEKEVKTKLNTEELELYRNLVGIGNNLNQLTKKIHQEGVNEDLSRSIHVVSKAIQHILS